MNGGFLSRSVVRSRRTNEWYSKCVGYFEWYAMLMSFVLKSMENVDMLFNGDECSYILHGALYGWAWLNPGTNDRLVETQLTIAQ